ncbi:oxidoreductase-like protein [Delphinella strobiligena]|nr:oxidoreductase-like protein [Delphinella strobiligena]
MSIFQALPWHGGEDLVHKVRRYTTKCYDLDNPNVPMLSQQAVRTLGFAPLLAIGAVDSEPRPWTTIWGGEPGHSRPLGQSILGIRTPVAALHDPVVESLVGIRPDGEVVKEQGQGRMVSGLTIDFVSRKRVKLYGRMVAGALSTIQLEDCEALRDSDAQTEIQLVLRIEQSLGVRPLFLERSTTSFSSSSFPSSSHPDTFFISSRQAMNDMDTNFRGGPAGFVRVLSSTTSTTLVWPEFSGNRLYQTLGNLQDTPLAGLCFPDFATGHVLYMTGVTEIVIGDDAADLLPRSNLVVKLTVTAARFVSQGLPFRGEAGEPSPYNPAIRYLRTEKPPTSATSSAPNTAKLLSQTPLTPTISRFRFESSIPTTYTAGQYVTLDLSTHLNQGYNHMNDSDPRSLSDDYIRTFTVSNPPTPPPPSPSQTSEFNITIRRVGPVTNFLFAHGLPSSSRASAQPLEIDVNGFGGDFSVSQPQGEVIGFVAAGVGLTPLLPALRDLDPERATYPVFGKAFKIFIGGRFASLDEDGAARDVAEVVNTGAEVFARRMRAEDLSSGHDGQIRRYYICTGTAMREDVLKWLPDDKETIYEDFNF